MPYVYRAFDHSGALLYVGRAKNWGSRWAAHSTQRPELFRITARLEVQHFASEAETARCEAELIQTLDPPWNRQRPSPPEPWFRCRTCGMGYAEIQDVSERVIQQGREVWSVAGLCNDMSGQGGTLERPCRGVLVAS